MTDTYTLRALPMLERLLGEARRRSSDWESLSFGAPTLLGFAHLAASAMSQPQRSPHELSDEARAILVLARHRGLIELRGTNDAFAGCDRLLMVHLETEEDRVVRLRFPGDVRRTVRFLEGLRQLCEAGLVLHHLQREFTLSDAGFQFADTIDPQSVSELLDAAEPIA